MRKLEQEEYWFWICGIPGVGRKTIAKLLEIGASPEAVFSMSEASAEKLLKKSQLESFIYSRNTERIQKEYEELKQRGIRFISCEQDEYPSKLRNIYDFPYGLYIRGKLPDEHQKTIAIVGTREPDHYGKEMARVFAKELARQGIQIVSGLARGIDSIAHQGAIEGGGTTSGVLGCGINICYPKENISLLMEMVKKGGVISEYGMNVKPHPGLFPLRNRIISGISDGILVVEARKQSGSLITADQGLDQGKDIFALPGRSMDPLCEGCNNLIKIGAKLVQKPEDILEEYGIKPLNCVKYYENNNKMLDKKQSMVYHCLSLEPKYIDTIIKETKLPVQEVLSILFTLELGEHIKQIVKNYYIIRI